MIKVDDIVRVTDWSGQYSTNTTGWFTTYLDKLDIQWIIRYAYGDNSPYIKYKYDDNTKDNTKYRVLFVTDDTDSGEALITDMRGSCCVYLIDTHCLELYDTPTEMTISEIEEKLGITNLKIIKEKDNG